jgi:flagellar hook-associated protein FlgK
MDLSGYTAGEAANLQKVGTWASYLTLAVTFSLAIFLALLKKQQMANSYAYKRYKKWNETIKKTNEYTQAKIKAKQDLENIYKPLIDKYWQLVKELERIWGIEYDEQDKGLFEGFQNLKRSSGLKINDDAYKKFEDVLYSDYDLFKYGIEKDSEVKIIIAQLNENNPAIIPDTVK